MVRFSKFARTVRRVRLPPLREVIAHTWTKAEAGRRPCLMTTSKLPVAVNTETS